MALGGAHQGLRKDWLELTDDMGERGVNQMVAFLAASTVNRLAAGYAETNAP
ncbi:hypothetical protein AB0N28_04155 [Streptomyces sp. NPDC051130]|uniref:hypothetical protein n=1 Tax=Streptomyces sp. NPDC051130 TaxID=3157223 RepID=UPI00341D812C